MKVIDLLTSQEMTKFIKNVIVLMDRLSMVSEDLCCTRSLLINHQVIKYTSNQESKFLKKRINLFSHISHFI